MKKLSLAFMALLAFSFSLKAQQYVSTEPTNRNVILEEFTGRTCTWCPSGHVIANQIKAGHPDRFWSVNIHSDGYFSATSYPNLNTAKGNQIRAAFGATSFPSGVVNRSTASAVGRNEWTGQSNNQFNQAAECNVGGRVIVNPTTRMATINVEVYYTANSSANENYLTVCMVQDSIWGSQTGGSDNPAQWQNGQYCHMHIFRDIVTDVMGDAISPTTQGTLITRNYEYEIPQSIGNPNGVEVDLDNIHFLAWVSERYQGSPTRPILTACELDMIQGSDEPIYPMIREINQIGGTTCTHTKTVQVKVQNGGTQAITAMTIETLLEGNTYTLNWEGQLEQYATEYVEFPIEVPFGDHSVKVSITQANSQSTSCELDGSLSCLEWQDFEIEGAEEQLTLELMQDKFGNHITWEFTTPNGTVLASGGPYTMLASGTGTQLHIEHATVPVDECVKFTIYDQMGNGICCNTGNGYYIVKDSQGNVLFGDQNDGAFGEEASHLLSVKGQADVEISATEVFNVDCNHADFAASLNYTTYPDQVGFSCRKVTSSEPITIIGILNEFQNILGFTNELDPSSLYVVRAFATVSGVTYYGAETTFQTLPDGVNELEQSLKLYPNPTSGLLNIQGEGMKSVEVYNTVGQRVMMQEVNGNATQINTESLNVGIYFLRIVANDGSLLNRTFSVTR